MRKCEWFDIIIDICKYVCKISALGDQLFHCHEFFFRFSAQMDTTFEKHLTSIALYLEVARSKYCKVKFWSRYFILCNFWNFLFAVLNGFILSVRFSCEETVRTSKSLCDCRCRIASRYVPVNQNFTEICT